MSTAMKKCIYSNKVWNFHGVFQGRSEPLGVIEREGRFREIRLFDITFTQYHKEEDIIKFRPKEELIGAEDGPVLIKWWDGTLTFQTTVDSYKLDLIDGWAYVPKDKNV